QQMHPSMPPMNAHYTHMCPVCCHVTPPCCSPFMPGNMVAGQMQGHPPMPASMPYQPPLYTEGCGCSGENVMFHGMQDFHQHHTTQGQGHMIGDVQQDHTEQANHHEGYHAPYPFSNMDEEKQMNYFPQNPPQNA